MEHEQGKKEPQKKVNSEQKENVSEDTSAEEREDTREEFQTVVRRKRQRKNIGTGNSFNDKELEFSGGERKVWLYINRVKRAATEEVIKKYIKNNVEFENEIVQVKELPSDENRLKAFVVTASLKKKDILYDPSFWPSGVGISRFDFNRHKDFLSEGNFAVL
uniref:Uncharacterized protein LOC114329753 isoform X1 n=1 Tax=Diabrotica virgifera virgifera TaxID=50390 RepID=A0A6P7FFF3_DIAVI